MMSTRWIPLLFLSVLWPAGAGADEFRSQGFGCHVAFPGKHVTAQERTPTVGWVVTELQEGEKGTFALSAFDLPIPELPPKALEAVMNSARAEAVGRKGYVLVHDDKRKLNDRYPGLDLVLEKKQQGGESQWIRLRIYFVGTRIYQVMVSGEKGWTESEEATKFLDSFGLNG